MGAIGYNAPNIMFIHALTTPLFSMTPLITIKGAIKKHTTNLWAQLIGVVILRVTAAAAAGDVRDYAVHV